MRTGSEGGKIYKKSARAERTATAEGHPAGRSRQKHRAGVPMGFYGDDINVAAPLEELAKPGTVHCDYFRQEKSIAYIAAKLGIALN